MLIVYSDISDDIQILTLLRRTICIIFLKIPAKLAQGLLDKICANLIAFLRKIIFSSAFLERHRQKKTDFSRCRLLPFTSLVLYLCNFTKSSYQSELNKFFKIINNSEIAKQVVSKVALCKARKKLKYTAFVDLNDHASEYFYQHFKPLTWNGFFLKAVDGSTVKLPNFPDIADHFGTWKVRQGDPVPMARISQMFDPLNQITTHALIGPKAVGEREMAASHFERLTKTDLVILDRGYPAFWLFKLILSRGAQFCVRVPSTKWKTIRKFAESGLREQIIWLKQPSTSVDACTKYRLDSQPICLRLVCVELSSGEVEILITSLTDSKQYRHEIFKELYHARWPVEEDYKVMKCRIELENFSGQTSLSVYQDFYAKVFSKNITSMLTFAAKDRVDETTANRKHIYKINFTQALSMMRDAFVVILLKSKLALDSLITDLLDTFAMAIEPVRPSRQYSRNHKSSSRKYYINYKPVL